jgi:type IV pilus assembly protein PilA
MFCVRCGAANADGSQFCVKCGAPIGAQAGAPAPAPTVPPQAVAGSPVSPAPAAYAPARPAMGPVESSGKAVGSLICGFLFFIFPVAIVGVVLGHLALSDIRKSAGRLTGRGLAIAGLVLGYMGILFIPFVLIVAAIAIPNLLRARMAANEATAVANLRVIASGSVQYSATYENGYPPSLDALGGRAGETEAGCDHALLISPDLTMGQMHGYVFSYAPAPSPDRKPPVISPEAAARGCTVAGSPDGFSVAADPATRGTTGHRSFYIDQSGVIRFESDGPASATSDQLP